MPGHEYGDFDEPTRPESPSALLARTLERFRSSVESVCHVVPMLELLRGSEKEYFGQRLADELADILAAGKDIETWIRVSRTR